jgi:light-regulated signal transduction histidine kinase (bacteriophytochrome)
VDHFETIRRRKDGTLLNISLTISPVRDPSGQIVGASKVARDITRQKQAEEERERSHRDLRRANQDLETFAYSASHDLQEPLRMIAISAQLLERNAGELSEPNKCFLKGVLDGAGRMRTLLEDLLSYTRATRREEGPIPTVDSGKVLAAVLRQFKPSLELSHARVVTSPLPSLPVHEVHLTQLFQNLLGNALKYRSTEDPYVQISAVESEGCYLFSVSDNGLGIDSRFRDQIFGLFKRLHTREEYPGSGIGLAICKRIVEQYGGRIWLQRSAPGGGSVFSFALPLQPDPGL